MTYLLILMTNTIGLASLALLAITGCTIFAAIYANNEMKHGRLLLGIPVATLLGALFTLSFIPNADQINMLPTSELWKVLTLIAVPTTSFCLIVVWFTRRQQLEESVLSDTAIPHEPTDNDRGEKLIPNGPLVAEKSNHRTKPPVKRDFPITLFEEKNVTKDEFEPA